MSVQDYDEQGRVNWSPLADAIAADVRAAQVRVLEDLLGLFARWQREGRSVNNRGKLRESVSYDRIKVMLDAKLAAIRAEAKP